MLQHGRLARRLALGAVIAAAALPATAAADSIVYVKDGNIWLTEPDGSRQYQVTFDGGYTGVSQSDNGVIVGAKSRKLYRLARTGEVLNEINTPMKSLNWNGPYDIDVSPDGTKVASGFIYQFIGVPDDGCTASWCYSSSATSGVVYAQTDGPASGVEAHTGWSYPAWVDNGMLLHSNNFGIANEETILRPFGSPNSTGEQWFTHPVINRMRDATVKDQTLAFVGPDNGQLLAVVHFDGAPGSAKTVDECFVFQHPTGEFATPTLAPGTTAMAWAEGDGIWRADFPNPSDGCDVQGPAQRMLIPGGSSPDWGPGDVPPARPSTGGGDGGTGGGGGTTTTTPKPPTPPTPRRGTLTLTVPAAKLTQALSKGLTVKVAGAGSGTVSATARISAKTARKAKLGRKARTVATGSARATSGTATVKLKFGRTTAKRLRRLKTVPLTITAGTAKTTLTLRR